MVRSGEPTRRDAKSTLLTTLPTLLILCALLAPVASAQTCADAKQRMRLITATDAQPVADSLRTVLKLASFVRDCEDQVLPELEHRLLNDEVFALNALDRHEEASTLVARFFETYADDAPDNYLARFHLWRLRLSTLSGNAFKMVARYAEAQVYAHALDPASRAHLYLDGAYVYLKIGELETTLKLTEQARDLIGTPDTYDERTVNARAVLLAAEADLRRRHHLDHVKQQLRTTARLYATLGDTSRVVRATTLLGMANAAAGDTITALTELATSTRLAETSCNERSKTFSLYRQGQLLREWSNFDAAEETLTRALAISETASPEFFLEINYELARLYEERHQYKRAAHFFQVAVDAPKLDFADTKEAHGKAQEGLARALRLLERRKQVRTTVALLVILLLAGTGGFLFFLRRRAISPPPAPEGTFIPKRLSIADTLAGLESLFRKTVDPNPLGNLLAHLFATLFDPELVLVYITDPHLVRQVETDTLKDNTALFLCVATVEAAIAGGPLNDDAASTIKSYLQEHFDKQGWPWPTQPLAWKVYFLQHHADLLP